jgi:Tol biopolymer transport system component
MFDNPQRQNADIYTICPDGNDLVRLTHDSATDESPAWSLDGTKIAFVSSRSGTSQIYLMNADGSAPMQITFDYENSLPKWLPDGKHIAFLTTDAKGLWWWRVARIDGNEVKQLTEPSYDFFYQTPSWAPDGIRIAYMSLEEAKARNDGSSQIHVKNADGTDDHALTNDIWANINPVWSPDGMKLAFLSERDGTYNVFALYIMNSDGSDVHKLTEPIFEDVSTSYSWSSDGKQIVIGDAHTGCIFIINLAMNSKAEALINEGGIAFAPSWQP